MLVSDYFIGVGQKSDVTPEMEQIMRENSEAIEKLLKLPKDFPVNVRPYKGEINTPEIGMPLLGSDKLH
jgi:hypothetical protein